MPALPSHRPGRRILPPAFLLLLAASAAQATVAVKVTPEPFRPPTRSYFSANGEYRVKIKPRDMLPARAVVSRRRAGGWFTQVARFRLQTSVSDVFVANDGSLVVTSGIPEEEPRLEVLAVYQTGPPARAFLVDGISTLLRSVHLRDSAPILDEARGHLVFGLPDWGDHCYELAIDLATGRPLTAPEDVFPKPRVEITAAPAPPAPEPPAATAAAICGEATAPGGLELVRLSGEELLASAREKPLPYYTEVAKKVRYAADVTADVVVSEHGRTMCIRTSPAAMGLDRSAAEALRKWIFEPPRRDGRLVRAVGRVVVRFERVGGVRCREIDPP